MEFFTSVPIQPRPPALPPDTRWLSLGSCFADAMGERLKTARFPVAINPTGVVFNPLSLASLLQRALERQPFKSEEFFLHRELWSHFFVQSSLASVNRTRSERQANQALETLCQGLSQTDALLVTFGTAWTYRHRDSGRVVAHNHRLPLAAFERQLARPTEIADALLPVLQTLVERNPRIRIILTVSPVRHTREGFPENNRSKAALLLAAHDLADNLSAVDYFPAYEILLDELRDYRFYADDLVHPSPLAIDRIWSAFQTAYLSTESQAQVRELEAVCNAVAHRHHHPDTKAATERRNETIRQLEILRDRGLDVSALFEALARREP